MLAVSERHPKIFKRLVGPLGFPELRAPRCAGRVLIATATNSPARTMLEADQWDSVLANVRGTVVRGTERVSSSRLLALLEVGPDPVTRQRMGKRQHDRYPLERSREISGASSMARFA